MKHLDESLDEIYPIQRQESKISHIFDHWSFDVENGQEHAVRFVKGQNGPKTSRIVFGVKRGKKIVSKIESVPNIRKYLATVMRAVETALENPTKKVKGRIDGFEVNVPQKAFDILGDRMIRILSKRLRARFNVADKYTEMKEDGFSCIFVWKKSKQFSAVFQELDKSDIDVMTELGDVAGIASKKHTEHMTDTSSDRSPQDAISSVSSTASADSEIDFETNTKQKSETDVVIDKKSVVYSMGGKDIRKKLSQQEIENKVKRLAILSGITSFYHSKEIFTDVPVYGPDDISSLIASGGEIYMDFPKLIYSLMYKIKGVYTDDIMWGSDYAYLSDAIKKATGNYIDVKKDVQDIIEKKLPSDYVVEMALNVDNINKTFIDRYGVSATDIVNAMKEMDPKGYKHKNLELNSSSFVSGIEDTKQAILDALASSDTLETSEMYKFEESIDGKRMIRGKNYTFEDVPANHYLQSLIRQAKELPPEEYLEIQKVLPEHLKDYVISDDLEYFETMMVSGWTISGGNVVQTLAHRYASEVGVNAELGEFWNSSSEDFSKENVSKAYDIMADKIAGNFESIYGKTQSFYKNKMNKKYETAKIKLYRGIGQKDVGTYTPGSLESWTSVVSTAKKFAKMMSDADNEGTILYAEVPIQHIFGSYESFYETWPNEQDLKGKKEFIVMGGTFATTPLYLYDPSTKEKVSTLNFKEWIELKESKETKSIKVVTPSDDGFDPNDPKAAFGNDPKEEKIDKREE